MANEQIDLDKKLLERGYWIATHRIAIERWTARVLYGVIAFVYLIFFVQFALYTYHLNDWQRLFFEAKRPLINWGQITAENAPLEPDFGKPMLFASGERRYDMVVEMYNPNMQWALESFSYQFVFGDDKRTEEQRAYLLPGERRYIAVLAFRSETPIESITNFETSGYRWRKMTKAPPLSWNFTEPPTYTMKQVIVEKGVQKVIPAQVTWKVQNMSTLNLRTVTWQVAYLSGSKLVGLAEYRRENFPFLEERAFAFAVSDFVGRVDRVKVYPLVNIFDPDFSYLPAS